LFFPFFLIGQLWEYLALGNIKIYYALSSEEIAYLKKIAPDSRIKFQTMGIEDECFAKISRRGARKKLDLNEKDKILLFLGRINYIKGVKILLDAMKKLKDFKLKIIGFGPQEKEFKDYAKQNKISNVEFLGPIFGNKKLLYLSAADALVLPSSKEGAPVTVMEAMARNTPSIVSDVGGVRLMIRDGKNGVIIKSRDKKAIINAVKKITEKPIKNAFSYAQAYKWQDIVEKTIKDYKDI
jgi:glycosyltransferase involved in cell wall biosynthesis